MRRITDLAHFSCGMQCIANLRAAKFECRLCNNKTEISQIFIPYAAKLLFQEVSPSLFCQVHYSLPVSSIAGRNEHCVSALS
jgi:hypothetical protein